MTELLKLRRATGATLCVECGKCSSLCPLAPFGAFSAARTMSLHDPESEIQHYARAVECCLTCGACELRCPQGVRYTEFVRGLRQDLPSGYRRPRPHGAVFQAASRLRDNNGEPPTRPDWLTDDLRVSLEGELALFVGCLPLFDVVFGESLGVQTLDIARSAIRMLNAVDVEPVLVSGEACCGHDLLWGGDRDTFELLARSNTERFQGRGVRHILTVCAECCRTWKVDYAEVVPDYRPKVQHLTEFLEDRIETVAPLLQANGTSTVTYQDPCRLGRHLGVVEEPRRLLTAVPGAELVEMERSGVEALCCGTSGFIHCDSVSRQLQSNRLRHASATGADRVLTACPKCLVHFRCSQTEDQRQRGREPSIEVQDLTVYLAEHLAPRTGGGSSGETTATTSGES